MIEVNVDQAIAELRRFNRRVSKYEVDAAIRLALNDAIAKSKTAVGRAIRKNYPETAFTPAATNAGLIIQKAVQQNLTAKLFVSGKPLPVTLFKPKQTEQGVTVEILRGQRKLIQRAFFARFRGAGKQWVTARGRYEQNSFAFRSQRVSKTGNDLPIAKLMTMGLPGAVMSEQSQALEAAGNAASVALPQRIQHYIDGITEGTVRLR